ncbi:MAG: type II toxin-antitoxin system VapB family antitoxin [Sphingobacteriaceae bacterium]|nr:type II toxin-antitoxin system VapB family antitoxin [Cytophagaceae bacterium]
MKKTIEISEHLLDQVRSYGGGTTEEEAIHNALKRFVAIMAGRDLNRLRGQIVWEGNLEKMRTDDSL